MPRTAVFRETSQKYSKRMKMSLPVTIESSGVQINLNKIIEILDIHYFSFHFDEGKHTSLVYSRGKSFNPKQ